MNVYVFQAALLCESCGESACIGLPIAEDSDRYPQGPYADGGGEADSPQCCDHCFIFLRNPLTPDGLEYVTERVADGTGNPDVIAEWRELYGL